MAERRRSQDGRQETRSYRDEDLPTPGQQGRAEGGLERQVGTRDEWKRATSDRPGATRVTKSDTAGGPNAGGRRRDVRGPAEPGSPAAPALRHGTWVLVADSEKALLLRNETDAEDPHLVVVGKERQDNPSTRAQGAHKPGRMGDTGVGQRSALADTDWHWLGKERFAADLAGWLYRLARDGAFDRLILVAGPRVLGALRHDLHKEVSERVVAEIDRNLAHEPVDAIERHVAEALARG